MEKMKVLELLWDDGDTVYFTDGEHNYGLNYWYIPKEDLREYADQDLVSYTTEPSPDGDGCIEYYYDDDSWEVEFEMVEEYIKDYIKYDCGISESGDSIGASQGGMFYIKEGDNGWYETLIDNLKK